MSQFFLVTIIFFDNLINTFDLTAVLHLYFQSKNKVKFQLKKVTFKLKKFIFKLKKS